MPTVGTCEAPKRVGKDGKAYTKPTEKPNAKAAAPAPAPEHVKPAQADDPDGFAVDTTPVTPEEAAEAEAMAAEAAPLLTGGTMLPAPVT